MREVATNYWRHARVLLLALFAALIAEAGTGLWVVIAFLVLPPILWSLYEGLVVNLV